MNAVDPRHRYASFEELEAIFSVMAYHQEQTSCDVIRFLILTGARKGEALKARWQDIDLINGTWTKPSSHTKQKKMHRVPLSGGATELLRKRFKQKSGPWVFRSSVTDGHLVDFKRTWLSIKKQASLLLWKKDVNIGAFIMELEDRIGKPVTYEMVVREGKKEGLDLSPTATDLRVHDLRHTYASILASQGHSLALIGALLGHSQTQTTKRYAHLLDDPLREATNGVDAFLKVG
jgi:integrase